MAIVKVPIILLVYFIVSAAIRDINGFLNLCERLYGYYKALKARKMRRLLDSPTFLINQSERFVSNHEPKLIQGSYRRVTSVRPNENCDMGILCIPHHGSALKKPRVAYNLPFRTNL